MTDPGPSLFATPDSPAPLSYWRRRGRSALAMVVERIERAETQGRGGWTVMFRIAGSPAEIPSSRWPRALFLRTFVPMTDAEADAARRDPRRFQ